MSDSIKRTNVLLNVAIVLLAVALVVILYGRLTRRPAIESAGAGSLYVGSPIAVAIDWKQKNQTLLLMLDKECPHCSENAEMYRRLLGQVPRADTHVVALMGLPVAESKAFLDQLGLHVDEVRQVSLRQIGVYAVPSLASVDRAGVVRGLWTGKLSAQDESDLVARLHRLDESNVPNPHEVFIEVAELKPQLDAKPGVTVLDVDEREQFAAAHIPQAVNIPMDELEARAKHELTGEQQIVVYCRCLSDGGSRLAVRILQNLGFKNVRILKGGLAAWQQDAGAS
jgi:rhodanese-related sulfurtransferase